MKRNNFFSRFIVVTLLSALLLVSGSRAICVSALAVGPISEPIYETEIIQLKEYIESGTLTPAQLPIFYFLLGSLAVAQLGASDAMLRSPYTVADDIHEWFVNMGINLYNSLIGLVPEGNFYVGDVQGTYIPRSVIKGLVAAAMGDAVMAANYPDLDTFLEENPDHIFVNFNRDLQLGVNAIFGLNGGAPNWQITTSDFSTSGFRWKTANMSGTLRDEYNSAVNMLGTNRYLWSPRSYVTSNGQSILSDIVMSTPNRFDLFINNVNHTVTPIINNNTSPYFSVVAIYYNSVISYNDERTYWNGVGYNPNDFNSYQDIANYYINYDFTGTFIFQTNFYDQITPRLSDLIDRYVVGGTYETAIPIENISDLNYTLDNLEYYEQVENDYLLDIRGLIGDLVNYVYLRNPVFDNIYDPDGNNVVPVLVQISTQLQQVIDMVAPPIPVNMNDIAELTDNTYLERVKEHARNAGDIFANYVAFWHNCDSDLVYTMFGAAILVLVGAFVGKWGHS